VRGFSLVETLVVMLLLAIGTGMAVQATARAGRADAAAARLANALSAHRDRARAEGLSVTVGCRQLAVAARIALPPQCFAHRGGRAAGITFLADGSPSPGSALSLDDGHLRLDVEALDGFVTTTGSP
jgi:prepilin-type N-terminal cleavage/methylation domain-containing protein